MLFEGILPTCAGMWRGAGTRKSYWNLSRSTMYEQTQRGGWNLLIESVSQALLNQTGHLFSQQTAPKERNSQSLFGKCLGLFRRWNPQAWVSAVEEATEKGWSLCAWVRRATACCFRGGGSGAGSVEGVGRRGGGLEVWGSASPVCWEQELPC